MRHEALTAWLLQSLQSIDEIMAADREAATGKEVI